MSLETAILDVLSRSLLPVKAAVLGREVKALVGKGVKKEFLMGALEGLVRDGRVRAVAMTVGKAAELSYSTAGLGEMTAQVLRVKVQAAVKPVKVAELKKKLPAGLRAFYEEAFEGLLKRGEIFVLPAKAPVVMKRAPRPSDFLEPAKVKTLRALFAQVSPFRRTAVTMEDFIAWLDGEAEEPGAAPEPAVTADKPVLAPTEALLRRWYQEDRRRSSTQMIPIPETWRRYAEWAAAEGGRGEEEVFKTVLQNLYNAGQVLLEPCERPQDLPVQERSLLVPLAIGPPGFAWSWVSS